MTKDVKLVWATPAADAIIAYIARVSNPANQSNEKIDGLLRFCMDNGHNSIFTMANACLEFNTTRDIGRQILRHWSIYMHELDVQEFSQRYKEVDALGVTTPLRECRMQDSRNRQSSLPCEDDMLAQEWRNRQAEILVAAVGSYRWALEKGVAKEQARVVLPEGLTQTRFYLNGNLRNWIFYLKSRTDPSTQKEHRDLAVQALEAIRQIAPVTIGAFFPDEA